MKKRLLAALLAAVLALSVVGCSLSSGDAQSPASQPSSEAPVVEAGKAHIGLVTGTASQGEDEIRAAEAFVKEYGSVADGGIVNHVTYPDNFMAESETTIAQIVGLADDPDMKAIIVCQGVPGTAAAFKKIRETRPDIVLLAGEPQEDPNVITEVADVSIGADNINRGYLMIAAAKKMGAKNFVHVSFPRHMSIESLGRRYKIFEAACADLGINFYSETAPDPMSDVGMPGAQQYILEQMPAWVEKYGKDTVFFCTNDGQTEPLLKRVAELGAMFVEPDLPSPIMGYPGAFGIDLTAEAGDWPKILAKVEETVVANGGAERMGTWAYSFGYTTTIALAEFGKRVAEGAAKIDSQEDLMACFEKYTPGAKWNGSVWKNVDGTSFDSYYLLYQDTYVFGKGYLGMTDEVVPEKYYTIK